MIFCVDHQMVMEQRSKQDAEDRQRIVDENEMLQTQIERFKQDLVSIHIILNCIMLAVFSTGSSFAQIYSSLVVNDDSYNFLSGKITVFMSQ